uniref:(northern house mosquito) hypothetical protein n=1 Tax=Culex pipiens TaxID=7175 RepID=A0A8D8A111_CULPI
MPLTTMLCWRFTQRSKTRRYQPATRPREPTVRHFPGLVVSVNGPHNTNKLRKLAQNTRKIAKNISTIANVNNRRRRRHGIVVILHVNVCSSRRVSMLVLKFSDLLIKIISKFHLNQV